MSLSEKDIEYVAKLARISIDNNDLNDFADDLSSCLDYFALINDIDTSNIDPTSQSNNLTNVMREDEIEDNMHIDDVLMNAPEHIEGFIKLPKVID
ncbi:MAG: Asp-tRNA(Asn)/Glu-tRNA(Gln) amidotransferase GatCAB subunit C [Dehalococcoidaceae bacterium]|nr:Asp-tRNA(Asn)/Glu-tRNA(Gln) amidotransferase GatCAB subunit C [Dehalococcoidaceae bacterium]|tara:strand:- start:2818 stop:3105 length:288 start_codon:yes stop_codon:yes gene_type:complete